MKIKKWLISVAILTLALVMAGCGQASLTVVVLTTSGDPGDISLDFQDDDGNTAGRLFVRTENSNPDGFVPFFVEIPIIPDQDYRLNSILLEFVSEAVQPSILLEPSAPPSRRIEFSRSGNTVQLHIPDTGREGDGTILIRFLAENTTFGEGGLRLNARLKFGNGIGEASLTIKPVS